MEIPIKLQEMIDPNKECCCIYHFSNKCKEWAGKYKFNIASTTNNNTPHYKGFALIKNMNNGDTIQTFGLVNTEQEAIFKACQWIMERINENK